tara:strand:+ start:163 stop:555 length:393 start_codon:yes stop_codon:yes gene_type:complete
MKINKSILKALIKEAIQDIQQEIQEASENPFDTPEMKALAKLDKDAKRTAKNRAEFDKIRKTGKMTPSKPGAGAKKSNPVATKFDVMKKLEKKVGKMAMKVIVGALEKDPRLMTTLSMVLKEEVESTEVK